MANFLKKISKGATNMFSKVDKGADNLFSKTKSVGNKVSSNIVNIGDKVAGVGRQAGNFLEKNSAILGDVAGSAAMATGFGAPLGSSIISVGNIGAQMEQRLKQGSQEIRNASYRTGSLLQSQIQNATNIAMMAKSNFSNQLNSNIGTAKQEMQDTINNAKSQAMTGLNMTETFH